MEDDTRQRILLHVLNHGPVSATNISSELGLTAAGVRRHLDNMVTEGLAEAVTAPKSGQRGRPAKLFRLTDAGRSQFGHGYDTLALLALRALRAAGGEAAVEQFAAQRVHDLLRDVNFAAASASQPATRDGDCADCAAEKSADAGKDPDPETEARPDAEKRARIIAEALTAKGYAATVNSVAGGVQICRHHCPIQDVAHEFPELCAAEHRIVSELLGQHIQPLATIADGNGICTTHIPLRPIHPTRRKH